MSKNYHYLFKYVVAGDAGAGKSTLIQQFTEESHRNSYAPTQRIHFASKTITVNELHVKCQVWDMKQPADLEKNEAFSGLADSLCKKAAAVILLFDLGNKVSFDGLERWVQDIRAKCDQNISIIIVGNKIDRQERTVSAKVAEQFSQKLKIPYFEISSFDFKAVSLLFQGVTKTILDKILTQTKTSQASDLKSKIKRGKLELQTPVSPFNSSNDEKQKEKIQSQQTKIEDSEQMFGIMDKMTESLKKMCLIEQMLKKIKLNIREKGLYYLRQIKNELESSRIAQSSSVTKDLIEIFSIIQESSSQQHMTLSRISIQNEELIKYKEVQSQIYEDREKIQQLQKKIQCLTLQKNKLEQYKENSESRQHNLLQMIDRMKKQRKAELQKNEKLQQSLSKLEQQYLQLAKQINRYKQQQEELHVQRLIQARQNSQIIDQLQTLQSKGVQPEIIGKLRTKLSVNSTFRGSYSEISETTQ